MLGVRGRYNFDMGHTYGEISVSNNDSNMAVSSVAFAQITDFDTTGEAYNTNPCGDNDHIEIEEDGVYLVLYIACVINDAAQSHIINVAAFLNNGTEEIINSNSNHKLTGGSTDMIHLSGNPMIALERGETVELWAVSDSADARNVIFEDVVLNVLRLGDA